MLRSSSRLIIIIIIINNIIIIIYLSRSWATYWPVPVSRIHKSLQRSTMIPSASWGVVFHSSPEAKGSNPTTGLSLLWARNPFRGNFNHWQFKPSKCVKQLGNSNHWQVKPSKCVKQLLASFLQSDPFSATIYINTVTFWVTKYLWTRPHASGNGRDLENCAGDSPVMWEKILGTIYSTFLCFADRASLYNLSN